MIQRDTTIAWMHVVHHTRDQFPPWDTCEPRLANVQVVNPAFVFPYKRYRTSSKDIIMYGELKDVLDGDGACAMHLMMLSAATSYHSIEMLCSKWCCDCPKRLLGDATAGMQHTQV